MSKITYLLCFVILAFGFVPNGLGQKVGIYELKKGDFCLKVTNFGARIISVVLPDKNGKLGDIVLGYDSLATYMNDTNYFGAIVGRVANRIRNARFILDKKVYKVEANDKPNMLNGGSKGFSQRIWKVTKYEKNAPSPFITLTYFSPNAEEGFPGDVVVSVTYRLVDPFNLRVTMKGKALNKKTPLNLAQHTYWNLGNHNSGDILSDQIQILATQITPLKQGTQLPNGDIEMVVGDSDDNKLVEYDFVKSKVIGSMIRGGLANGFDINYVLERRNQTIFKLIAIVKSKKSGRVMKLYTDATSVQFSTANNLKHVKGKDGAVYEKHSGLRLETQGFPDAENHPYRFRSTIVKPGDIYTHRMHFTFSTEK